MRQRARALRKNQTAAERRLWSAIRNRRLAGCKFRRQHPINNFIVDFACLERKLVIEVDGGQHAEEIKKDAERTTALEKVGFRVLRFWNHDVLKNMDAVLETILANLEGDAPSPHPSPPEGERE